MKSHDVGRRSIDELGAEEKQRLQEAHRRLREAVASYERFHGGVLPKDKDIELHDGHAMAKAQAAIEHAEDELWCAREELLGWRRPAWALSAARTSEWFSDEDAIYDELDPSESSPHVG